MIYQLESGSPYLRRSWIRYSRKSSRGDIDICAGEFFVALEAIPLVSISNYQDRLTSESAVVVALAKACLKLAEWTASLETGEKIDEILCWSLVVLYRDLIYENCYQPFASEQSEQSQ